MSSIQQPHSSPGSGPAADPKLPLPSQSRQLVSQFAESSLANAGLANNADTAKALEGLCQELEDLQHIEMLRAGLTHDSLPKHQYRHVATVPGPALPSNKWFVMRNGQLVYQGDDGSVCLQHTGEADIALGRFGTTQILRDHLPKKISTLVGFNNNRLVAGMRDGTIVRWDPTKDGRYSLSETFRGPCAAITCFDHLLDGSILSGSADGSIRIWRDGPSRDPVSLGGHGAKIRQVSACYEGSSIASLGEDGVICLWDPLKPGKAIQKVVRPEGGPLLEIKHIQPYSDSLIGVHSKGRSSHMLVRSPQGQWRVACTVGLEAIFLRGASILHWKPDGTGLIMENWDQSASSWKPVSGAAIDTRPLAHYAAGKGLSLIEVFILGPWSTAVPLGRKARLSPSSSVLSTFEQYQYSNTPSIIAEIAFFSRKASGKWECNIVPSSCPGDLTREEDTIRYEHIKYAPDGRIFHCARDSSIRIFDGKIIPRSQRYRFE